MPRPSLGQEVQEVQEVLEGSNSNNLGRVAPEFQGGNSTEQEQVRASWLRASWVQGDSRQQNRPTRVSYLSF